MIGLPELILLAPQLHKNYSKKVIESIEINPQSLLNISSYQLKNKIYGQKIQEISRFGHNLIITITGKHHLIIKLSLGSTITTNSKTNSPGLFLQINIDNGESIKFIGDNDEKIEYCYFDYYKAKLLPSHKSDVTEVTQTKFYSIIEQFDQKKKVTYALSFIDGCDQCLISETLFIAKVSPKKKIKDITKGEQEFIYNAIFEFINKSIGKLKKNKDFDGARPYLKVFDRAGKPCFDCGREIKKEKVGDLDIFFCNYCQK